MNFSLNSCKPPFFSIALLSATALSYEILLIRLFSIIQWHHFAYMVISLSLLGYGASGMFLSLARDWLHPRFPAAFMVNGLLFSFSSIICFLVGQQIPFNPLEMVWGSHQVMYLLILYLLLALPFFAVANCIGLTLSQFTHDIPRIYGFDLLGAGVGALGIIILLFLVHPMTALYVICSLGLVSTAVGFLESGLRPRWIAALLLAGAISLLPILQHQKIPLQISPYKSLSQTLTVMGTEVIEERNSPLGMLTVVKSPVIPFRHAPGLSLNTSFEPPTQLGVFTDGEGMSVITNDDGQSDSFAYTDFFTSALPYHLLSRPKVLILGAGGGTDVLQARYFGAESIDAVELNLQMADLVNNTYSDFAGNLYKDKNVHIHIDEARGFVAASKAKYDLIQVALLDAFSASSAGLYALSESYLYTTEAFIDYIKHLRPDGMLAITRWIKVPPRDGLKLFATAAAALETLGVKEPGRQLILIRSWKTSTLLIKSGVFSGQDIKVLREFCAARSFDLGYYPDIVTEEANRYNILDRPYFFEGTTALLNKAEGKDFLNRYKFNIKPATDDKPYFFHFFKWSTLTELLSLRAKGGLPLLEQGYIILIATLLQAILASVLLILVPLWYGYRRITKTSPSFIRHEQIWVVIYFFSLGIAFLFIEIAFIQKFILFLRHPLYAVGVVISGFLLFAGLGSNYSSHLQKGNTSRRNALILSVTVIAGVSLLYIYLLPVLFQHLLWLPDPLKVIASLCLIAPLAFCMGIPFPLGLSSLSFRAPELIPWAWGINGCASVISAVLATLLATYIGFRGIVVAAVCLYFVSAVVYAKSGSEAQDAGAFVLNEQPIPEPGTQDLLVRVIAIGMNPVDTKVRKMFEKDAVLGWDAYGIVEKTGEGVNGFNAGDKVYYAGDLTRPGCNSEYHLIDHQIAALAPKKLSPEDAVAMPLTSITAWEGLFERLGFVPEANANAGKSILIIGGAGGVGSVAIQLARWAGLKVFATASRTETVDWCRNLGADVILNHRNNLYEELKSAGTDSVDAIFCTTQMERHWKVMAECIRPQGHIVFIDDPVDSLDITVFKLKSVTLSWEFMYTRSMFKTNDMSEQGKLLSSVAGLLDEGDLVTTRQKTLTGLTPENIQAMHIKQESGTMMGKQVLVL